MGSSNSAEGGEARGETPPPLLTLPLPLPLLLLLLLVGRRCRSTFGLKFGCRFACLLQRERYDVSTFPSNYKKNAINFLLPEMVRPHEPLVADWADEVLLSRVCACVSGQFVATGESFAASRPVARERALAWN